MKNPLLVPEIREMLLANQIDELQDFCVSTDPSVIADFLGALYPQEIEEILLNLPEDTRSAIFFCLDEDIKILLIDLLKEDDLLEIISYMTQDQRFDFINELPSEIKIKIKIKTILQETQREDYNKLATLIEAAGEAKTTFDVVGMDSLNIEIYKTRGIQLEKIEKIENDCWINAINPGKKELDFFTQRFNIPSDFLTASLDMDEISRTETENDSTLIILKTPFFDETNLDVLYFTVPIGIILTNGIIITICPKESEILLDFIKQKVKNFSTARRNTFVLQLFLRATLLFLQYLKQINNANAVIQKKLEQSSKNKQLIKLLNIEKSLVYFTTSLKSNAFMLERLQKTDLLQICSENQDIFEDIAIESKQAIEMANIYSDILSGMMDAFASIISNNLNIVMKVLTSIAIIITIPVLISSLYGMNVKLPLQNSPHAFLYVIIISVILALIGVGFFVRKKWLEM